MPALNIQGYMPPNVEPREWHMQYLWFSIEKGGKRGVSPSPNIAPFYD